MNAPTQIPLQLPFPLPNYEITIGDTFPDKPHEGDIFHNTKTGHSYCQQKSEWIIVGMPFP